MSSSGFSTKRAFPERWSAPLQRVFGRWIRRRGPVHPPLVLGYRQIYILPTRFGWLIGLLLTAMLLGSLNFNNNLGLFTTFLVAGTALLSMHVAHRNLDGVRIAAIGAARTFAGDPLTLSISLHDTRGRARSGLVIEVPDGPPSRGAHIDAWQASELEVEVATSSRGWLTTPRLRLRTRYPLGWFQAWSWFWPERRFLVWPRPAESAPPLRTAGRTDDLQRPGDESDEFHGLREWREGDPLHRIAWKASQRHDSLLARQFTRPERGRIVLRLADAPAPDLEGRIAVLARWVLEAERMDLEYGLDLGSMQLTPGIGPVQRTRCLDVLAEFG